jgi:hypothetical protein
MIIQVIQLELHLSLRWTGRSPGLVCQAIETLRTPTWIPERGGLQGMARAITTFRLPLNRGAPSYSNVPMHPSTTPMYKETTYIPPGLQPYGLTSKNMGNPKEWRTATSTLVLLLRIQVIWTIKHNVEHVKTFKLYASSYIMIIIWRQLYSSSYALLYE